MRREILCSHCNTERIARLGSPVIDTPSGLRLAAPIGPKEYQRSIEGLSIRACHCDSCGKEIEAKEKVFAVSTWIDKRQEEYRWEGEYIMEEIHG